MRAAHLGRANTPEHNANIAKARLGVSHMSPEVIEKMRQTKISQHRHLSPEFRQYLSERWAKEKNPGWGQSNRHPRGGWVQYKGINMRSSWEVRMAKALDRRKIKWRYEPKRFNLGSCTYLPDFYLPETKSYIEVKGHFDYVSQDRVSLFRKLHPELSLIVATKNVLEMFEGGLR